ncbi:DJ-1/PfpI family protein, partial [Pseudomonas sp. MWU13-2860]
MTQERPPFHITIPIYPGVDLLDVAAPVELFSWMAETWTTRATTITLAAEHLSPRKT